MSTGFTDLETGFVRAVIIGNNQCGNAGLLILSHEESQAPLVEYAEWIYQTLVITGIHLALKFIKYYRLLEMETYW